MSKKLPALQFYPGDWMKDPALRRCTHAAKGVWIDILCLMWENEERGVLATAGQAWCDEDIARAVGGDQAVVLSCLAELTLKGVANRRSDGSLYSRRLVPASVIPRLIISAMWRLFVAVRCSPSIILTCMVWLSFSRSV